MRTALKALAVGIGVSVGSASLAVNPVLLHLDTVYSGATNPLSHPIATFHSVATGVVELVISGMSGSEFLSNIYFNYGGNAAGLTFTELAGSSQSTVSGSPSVGDFSQGNATGFEIRFQYPTANSQDRFQAGDVSAWTITGAGVSESLFHQLDESGRFFAVAHIQGIGPAGADGSFVGAVPEPETYAMLLAGLGLLAFIVNRRRRSLTPAL